MEIFTLRGTVLHGKKLGRTIGFPTANIEIHDQNIIPGTYGIVGIIDEKKYYGIGAYLDGSPTFEAHFFEFSSDIYERTIDIALLLKIRDNRKFDSFEALKEQIESDKTAMLEYMKNTSD